MNLLRGMLSSINASSRSRLFLGNPCNSFRLKVFRGPGARAQFFFQDGRLSNVLEWKHDLTLLWIGNNDISEITQSHQLAKHIDQTCGSKVIVIETENRKYQSSTPVIPNFRYQSVKRSVNRAFLGSRQFLCLKFNAIEFILTRDGVNFETNARGLINQKLIRAIQEWKENLTH